MFWAGRTLFTTFLAAGLAIMAGGQARAAERWAALPEGAFAQLPDPTRTETITGGKLVCAEQRWSLELSLADGVVGSDGGRKAEMAIGRSRFDLSANRTGTMISIEIPGDVLPPLRSGIRMNISVSGGEFEHRARFSLIGSRRTIEEVAPRCSQRDMSAYRAVLPGEFNPETVLARELLATEITAFTTATKSRPTVAAAMVDAGEGRRLLFATLCGSSWYYGNSGCNMTVHAQHNDEEWQRVYETEGVAMHIDRNSQSEGWPNLVALTFDGEEVVWRWMGDGYLPPIEGELRGG